MKSFISNLSSFVVRECGSVMTERALPTDHTSTIKLVRAYKIIISFSLKYSETAYLHRGSQAPFIVTLPTTSSDEHKITTESIYS